MELFVRSSTDPNTTVTMVDRERLRRARFTACDFNKRIDTGRPADRSIAGRGEADTPCLTVDERAGAAVSGGDRRTCTD